MNYDEFAFFNQQLGRMLKDGVPLEGALRRLCKHMRRGRVRAELEALGNDLADGRPLDEALEHRRLPALYVRLLRLGSRGGALPDVLLLLADHYQRVNTLWTRLKGLLLYPVLVLVLALGLSAFLAHTLYRLALDPSMGLMRRQDWPGIPQSTFTILQYQLLAPPLILTLLLVAVVACIAAPPLRRRLRWRLRTFRDAALARVGSALSLLLRSGATLDEAIDMARDMEGPSPAADDLAAWQKRLAAGEVAFAEVAIASTAFPHLFVWLVDSAGEDLAGGFAHAAEIYHERAAHRAEMALYGVLPVSILALGVMLFGQVSALMGALSATMKQLGGLTGL